METYQKYNIEVDKSQIYNLVNQLDPNDKIEILNNLQHSTFVKRIETLLSSLRTDDLTYEEITKEVEEVRQKRYEDGKHNA